MPDPAQTTVVDNLQEKFTVLAEAIETRIQSTVQENQVLRETAAIGGVLVQGFTALAGALIAAVGITQSFVQALDPGLIAQFQYALDSLRATVGVAFTGIFEQAIDFFTQIAGEIAPIFQALKPIVDQLVHAIFKSLGTVIEALVPIIEALIPIIQLIVDVFQLALSILNPVIAAIGAILEILILPLGILAEIISAVLTPAIQIVSEVLDGITGVIKTLMIIFKALVQALLSIFGGGSIDIKDSLNDIKHAFDQLTVALIKMVYSILDILDNFHFGKNVAPQFLKNIEKAFAPKAGESAAGGVSSKSLEQIGKDLAQASLLAAGGASEKDAKNKDILAAIKELNGTVEKGNDLLKRKSVDPVSRQFAREKELDHQAPWDPNSFWVRSLIQLTGQEE